MIPEGLVQGPTGPRGPTQTNKAKMLDKQSRGVRHTSILGVLLFLGGSNVTPSLVYPKVFGTWVHGEYQ
jgi:hypothetical protein